MVRDSGKAVASTQKTGVPSRSKAAATRWACGSFGGPIMPMLAAVTKEELPVALFPDGQGRGHLLAQGTGTAITKTSLFTAGKCGEDLGRLRALLQFLDEQTARKRTRAIHGVGFPLGSDLYSVYNLSDSPSLLASPRGSPMTDY
jgi:hypothetical protein